MSPASPLHLPLALTSSTVTKTVFHVGVSPARGAHPPPQIKILGGGAKFWEKFFARAFGARRAVLTYFGVVFSVFEAIWTLLRIDTSEAIFAFLSRFYANLSQFEDYCRLFEEFRERLWRERENLAIFALILGQKLPVWPPAGSQSTVLFLGGGSPPARIFSGGAK